MKTLTLTKRNFKELIRDPINIIFCLGLPLFLLVIFQQFKIPSEVYSLENFTPSIIIFSFGFISLFSATLISKDRTTLFLTRLFASPLKSIDFILAYSLALIPIVIMQNILFFIVAIILGLNFSINIILTILISIIVSFLFISLGILIGCKCSDKQSPAVSSLIIQLIAFTSGMWFDISMLSNVFKIICKALPFSYSVDLVRYSLTGEYNKMLFPLFIVLIFIIIVYTLAIIIFKQKMNSDNI